MWRAWIRLWVVATVVCVPSLALWQETNAAKGWERTDQFHQKICDEIATGNISPEEAGKCVQDAGIGQTMFQHEHITAGRWWGQALGFWFVVDLVLTALLVGAFFAVRWVVRGFRGDKPMSIEEWWGRTFEGRGRIDINNMPNSDIKTIQQLSTRDVAELYRNQLGVHGQPASATGLLAGIELRRRENWTGRAALVVSIMALFIAAASAALAAFGH